MAGQQRQRGQWVGGPAEDPLELVRDVLGHLHRQPQAGQVGEVPPGDVAEVDVGDLALGQDAQGGGQVQRQAQAAGEVVGGAEREHAQAHVAVGELVCRLAQASRPRRPPRSDRHRCRRPRRGRSARWRGSATGRRSSRSSPAARSCRHTAGKWRRPRRERTLTTSAARRRARMSAVSAALDRCCPGPVTTISILERAPSPATWVAAFRGFVGAPRAPAGMSRKSSSPGPPGR